MEGKTAALLEERDELAGQVKALEKKLDDLRNKNTVRVKQLSFLPSLLSRSHTPSFLALSLPLYFLPPSLPPFLPPFLPPSHPYSLSHSLPPSLPPSLPSSLTPILPLSFPPSLRPSLLPSSLTPNSFSLLHPPFLSHSHTLSHSLPSLQGLRENCWRARDGAAAMETACQARLKEANRDCEVRPHPFPRPQHW